jgi:hypothetical protein
MRIEGSRLLELAAAIGRELGGFRAEMVHSYGEKLVHADGRMLLLRSSWDTPEGMVTVSGRLDRDETYDGDAACGLERARINASVKRGPAAIARDITRRLMPRYEADLAEYRRRADVTRRRLATCLKLAEGIAVVIPGAELRPAGPRDSHTIVRWHGQSGAVGAGEVTIDYSGTSAALVVRLTSPESIRNVAEALRRETEAGT